MTSALRAKWKSLGPLWNPLMSHWSDRKGTIFFGRVYFFIVDIDNRDGKTLMMSAILILRLFCSNVFCCFYGNGVFQKEDAM